MAINIKRENLQKQIDQLKHNLSIQNISLENFFLVFRYKNGQFIYVQSEKPFEMISKEDLRQKDPLLLKIFRAKKDRDVMILAQPEFALKLLAENKEVEPVLDDLPQIVGMNCKICDATNENKTLAVLKKHDACLLRNHHLNRNFVLALAPSLDRAFAAILIVEKSSQAMLEAKCIGGAKKLPAQICKAYRKAYLTAYSKMDQEIISLTANDFTREISPKEMDLRQQVVDYGIHLLEENLTLGTWGNLSVRLDDKYMLITPSGMAYERITPFDIVRVNYHTQEHENRLKPSIEKGFHAAVYREHQDINAVIHIHSFNSSVFAAAGQALPIVMPEAIRTLGSKTGYAPYYKPGSEQLSKALAGSITDDVWCTIMESHGLACCGKDMQDVFARAKMAESAARYYLDMHQA